MSIEDNKLKELYVMAELAYKNKFNNYVNDNTDLFPIDWYKNKDYKKKIELIYNSIKNNVLIENSDLYKDYIGQGKHLSYKE